MYLVLIPSGSVPIFSFFFAFIKNVALNITLHKVLFCLLNYMGSYNVHIFLKLFQYSKLLKNLYMN